MRWFFLAGAFLPAGSTHQPRNGWTCVQPIGGLGPKSTNAPVASAPNFFWRCRFWPLLQRGGAAEPDAALRRFRRRAADDNAPHSYGPRFGPRRGFPRYMPRDSSPAPKLFNRAAKWLSARDFRHVRGGRPDAREDRITAGLLCAAADPASHPHFLALQPERRRSIK